MSDLFLSIIIPAKDEAHRIFDTIDKIKAHLINEEYAYEIIVVSDSSICKTIEMAKKHEGVKIIDQRNKGKGYAVKSGMLKAKGKYRLFLDADHSVKITNINKFIEEADKGNIAIASIGISGSEINSDNAIHRRILGRLSKLIISIVFNLGIKDTQRGFKLFPASAANLIFNKQTVDGFGFDFEIILIAKNHGFKIVEIPVLWNNPKESQVKILHYFKVLMELIHVKINQLSGKYHNNK